MQGFGIRDEGCWETLNPKPQTRKGSTHPTSNPQFRVPLGFVLWVVISAVISRVTIYRLHRTSQEQSLGVGLRVRVWR